MNSPFDWPVLFVLFFPVLWLDVLEIPPWETFIPFLTHCRVVLLVVLSNFRSGCVQEFQESGF